jgi:hypothetical protein
MGLPTWHEGTQRWAQKIGHKIGKSGNRIEAWFYFTGPKATTPPPEVIADAVAKQREWKQIKAQWDTLSQSYAAIDPDTDFSKPVWYEVADTATPEVQEEIAAAKKADAKALAATAVAELSTVAQWGNNHQDIIAYLRQNGLLPQGMAVATRKPTIREAIDEYLDDERKRIDLKIGARIDVGTYNTDRNNLLICVGLSATPTPTEKVRIIDLNKPLIALDNADIKAIANHWFSLPGNVSSRATVANYFSGFKKFLAWAERQDELGFTRPKTTATTLAVNKSKEPNVTETDFPTLKTILSAAPERTKMYILLALTCGFYQRDIDELAASEVVETKGEMFVTGYRSKEDGENGSKIKTTHWIAPELATMMREHAAPKNEWGFYFLNKYGRPMFSEKLQGGKCSAVAKAWEKAVAKIENPPTFKQLRKWGWNEIQKYATSPVCSGETLAKRWAGQTGSGIGQFYRFDDYAPVVAAQKAMWQAIKGQLGFLKAAP